MEGIERIKVLALEITDDALLEIIKYLTSREDMNHKYLNEEIPEPKQEPKTNWDELESLVYGEGD